LQQRQAGGKAGIGVILSKRSDVIYVVSREHDSAGAQADIRPGDYLLAVNGEDVENKSILEVDSLLHGRPGQQSEADAFPQCENQARGTRNRDEGARPEQG